MVRLVLLKYGCRADHVLLECLLRRCLLSGREGEIVLCLAIHHLRDWRDLPNRETNESICSSHTGWRFL